MLNEKTPHLTIEKDEFHKTKEILERFLITPRDLSGREVLVSLKFEGTPYPASKGICEAFNLKFGSTVGIKVSITKPEVRHSNSDLEELYIDAKQLVH